MTKYDDMNLDRHMGRIIPTNPRLSISEYIKDYRIKEGQIQVRMFLSDKWQRAMDFYAKNTNKNTIKYLRDTRKKESILFVTNGMIERGVMPFRALYLAMTDKLENVRNINRMVRNL